MNTIAALSHPPAPEGPSAVHQPLSQEQFNAWFRLLETPGVGRRSAAGLLAHWGDIEKVWSASPVQWARVIGAAAAQALQSAPEAVYFQRQEAAWRWLQGREDTRPALMGPRQLVTWGSPEYPQHLASLPDPPLMLYVCGSLRAWQRPCLAIVGSRNPTAQGLDHARAFAAALARVGWGVISGLALGIDGAAHEGALAARGATVAVVGTGPDRIYPRRHQALASHIIESEGALVSEFPPGSPVRQENFPMRNRIIAGLSLGTLVVEAAVESGSLITAKLALDAGREVFAIPGSIHSPQSKGCHALIRQGAKLVETAADILEELAPQMAHQMAPQLDPQMEIDCIPRGTAEVVDPDLQRMGHDPVTLDTLAWRSQQSVSQMAAQLLHWELQGWVARLPGGLYQRRSPSGS